VLLADSGTSDLVALCAIFFMFGVPVMGWIAVRMLAHRERMEMIRQGFDPRLIGKNYQAWQQAQPGPVPGPTYAGRSRERSRGDDDRGCGPDDPSPQIALRKAVVIVAVGFALTIGLSFIGWDDGRFTPGPWLLGGLVPLFVGLAQVFSAMAAGATFSPYAAGPQFGPMPPSGMQSGPMPPPSTDQGPPPSGSYTYRPGVTPELRPPVPPPVQRDN